MGWLAGWWASPWLLLARSRWPARPRAAYALHALLDEWVTVQQPPGSSLLLGQRQWLARQWVPWYLRRVGTAVSP